MIAEPVAIPPEKDLGDESAIGRRLALAEAELELGLLTLEEYESVEDRLLDRLELLRKRQSARF